MQHILSTLVVAWPIETVAAVGEDRGPTYSKANLDKSLFNWTDTKAIGSIPQVNHTYGYVEGVYGIMNEHQLGIGESTCGAKLWTKPVSQGGKALLDITELGRIALERTKTAKEAILLMGRLAEQYGYYGASWDSADGAMDEAGEALTVADPKEGWMFHILPDDSGTSAVWVAQRVPDNHITAIANQFVIRHINLTDSDNFLGSSNIFDVAIRNSFWDSTTPFDFTAAYALRESNPYTMTRRVWRILSLANSTIDLSPFTDAIATNYPFGPYAPSDTAYFPIYPKVSAVPDVASRGSLHAFDMSAAFWLNALIGNYASRYYKFTQPVVRAAQLRIEAKALEAQPAIHDKALSIFQSQGDEALETYLTNVCTSFAADA
ncbi:hypothetical protein DYB32_010124, partial [Aphanomyces invadans]